jgi:hypothetical protein
MIFDFNFIQGVLMNLLKDITANMQTEKSTGLVFRAIQLGMAPFQTGKIVAYISSWKGWERTVIFEVGRLPYMPFKITFEAMLDSLDYEQIYADAAEAAFKFYRYRPSLPIEDHIVLGEE